MRALLVLSLLAASAAADCSSGFKDGADGHVTASYRERRLRGGRSETIYTEAVVSWQPDQMLDDTTCFDMKAPELQIRVADGPADAWTTVDARPKVCGAASCWNIDIKPCLRYTFKIVLSSNDLEGTGATLELPGVTVGPAGEQELLDSGYMPDEPRDLEVEAMGTSATLRWTGVDCAQEYFITYKDPADVEAAPMEASAYEAEKQIDGLKECTRYDVSVAAYLGDEGSSDLLGSFMTKPRTDSLEGLHIEVSSQMTEVDVKWDTYGPVSCIDDYSVTVFDPADNSIPVSSHDVRRTAGMPFIEQKITGLQECTDYQMEVMPMVPGLEMTAKFVDFRTASPQASDLNIAEVVTVVGETAGTVTLSWTGLPCASSYVIYQKMADGEWTALPGEAEGTELTVSDITACTKYTFAVAGKLADGSETPKTEGQEIMSTLDDSQPFSAPGLVVKNMDTFAEVIWNHADCIDSYKVRACTQAYTDCPEHMVTPGEDKTIKFKVEGLEPCTHHQLEIIPITSDGGDFTAAKHAFTTTNGVPKPPAGFAVSAVAGSEYMGAAHMTWDDAQCATGYTVYRKRADDAEAAEAETDGTSTHQDALEPCQEYLFAVATRVDDTVSEKTEWQSVYVKPDPSVRPELKIVSSETENVTVSLKPSAPNTKCAVQAYEVRYSPTGGAGKAAAHVLKPDEAPNGDIRLPVSRDAYITGRIKYDVESDWTESSSIGDLGRSLPHKGLGGLDNKVLYPTVVGVAVLAIIVIVVTVLILRRKKTMRSFDAEKGAKAENGKAASATPIAGADANGKKALNGNDEETQKLNANHDDPENFA